jgi:cytochrome c oxidase assembly protein subunit 15
MSSTTAGSVPAALAARGPMRLAQALLVVTTITILWGAMTTSTGSGLAFRDWPLSDGRLMPERSYTTVPGFLEHFHRIFGAAAGLLALGLALWLHLGAAAATGRARTIAWFGGCLLLVQGVVGGVGVRLQLPALTSVVHATLAQLTLATFAWLAYLLSPRHAATAPVTSVSPGAGRRLAVAALVVMVLQTVLGALVRHTNSGHALWTHVGNALVVFVLVTIATAFAIGRLAEAPGVRGLVRLIVTLLLVQIALGFVALAIRNAAGKTPENVADLGAAAVISVHVLIGAALTMLVAALAAHVFRATRRDAPAAAGAA